MDLPRISQNIRKMRQSQGMTVERLAARSGFSKGFISQVENFRVTPSLKALDKLASALGASIEALFKTSDPAPPYTFGRLDRGVELPRDNSEIFGMKYYALAWEQIGRTMNPFVIEYHPSANVREFMMHDTEEFFLVLEGRLKYCLMREDNFRLMERGDTLYMNANIPHRATLADSCEFAKALIIYSSPDGRRTN